MECQVCFMPYNSSSRMPKTLVCGHTFCMECLTKIQDAASSMIQWSKDRKLSAIPEGGIEDLVTVLNSAFCTECLKDASSSTLQCPKDRKMAAIPEDGIEDLITNFTAVEMFSDDCVDCHEKNQDGQCVPEHCSKLLCSDCKASHLEEFSQELVTELDAMKKQMSKQQAMCDDNTDLTKMMDQSEAAIAEISRVFDAEKENMIEAIRSKQETDGNDYFEWKGNFNVCLIKGRSFLDKVTSEITFHVDSSSGKYLSELKKQIISEKEAISEMELGKSQCSSFDASVVQQEFDRYMSVLYDLVMPSHGPATMSTAEERHQDVKQTGLIPSAGSDAGESSLSSGEASSPVTVESQSSLNTIQDELIKTTEDLAQLYHLVCEINGETPKRVMLEHVQGRMSKLHQQGSSKDSDDSNSSDQDKSPEKENKNEDDQVSCYKLVETVNDQIKYLKKAVNKTIKISRHRQQVTSSEEVCELREQVVKLKAMLSTKREKIATLRSTLKANKFTAEVALAELKSKYEHEKCIVTETMEKLQNELKSLKEHTATFESLRHKFAQRCDEYVAHLDEQQRQLSSAGKEKKTLNELLRMAIQQKLALTQRVGDLEAELERRAQRSRSQHKQKDSQKVSYSQCCVPYSPYDDHSCYYSTMAIGITGVPVKTYPCPHIPEVSVDFSYTR